MPIFKNNIIIKFSSNNTDFLFDCIGILSRVYLPQISIKINDEMKEIQDNRFLTIIKEAKQSGLFKKIFNYLWEGNVISLKKDNWLVNTLQKILILSKYLPCSSLNIK